MTTSQQDGIASITPKKHERTNRDDLAEPGDTPTRTEHAETAIGTERAKNPLFDDPSVDASFHNEVALTHPPVAFTAIPTPSSTQPEHAKLKTLRGTKLGSHRALLATQPAIFYPTITDLSKSMLDLSQKIRQRESSYSRFNEPPNSRDGDSQPVAVAGPGENHTRSAG